MREERIKKIEGLEKYLNEYKKEITQTVEELRPIPMPELTEELFALFEKTGNRIQYEDVYFLRRKYLSAFGIQSILYEKEEDIQKLSEILLNICQEECWALPAHVRRQEDPCWRIHVDLFASETAHSLAAILTRLEKKLPEEVKERVKEEVFRRVLNPFSESEIPYDSWERCENNWCAVCNGAIGCAAIDLMEKHSKKLSRIIQRICESLPHYLHGFSEDGVCMEGMSYFTYGMTYFVGFADKLYEYTEGKVDLLGNEKVKKIAEFQSKCYFSGGRTLSFSDGNSRDYFRVGLTCYLAMRFEEAGIPNLDRAESFHKDSCYRFMGNYGSIIWTQRYIDFLKQQEKKETVLAEEDAAETQITFSDAQWVICQSGKIAAAAKGGHNGEPHNHNDVGSFLYVSGAEMMLTDLGAGEYTKEYFNEKRYDTLCNSSLSHNIPLINGKQQLAGKEHACSLFETDGKGKTIIQFEGAYETGEVSALVRTLQFENGILKVSDRIVPSAQTKWITENLVTQLDVRVQKDGIYLMGTQNQDIFLSVSGLVRGESCCIHIGGMEDHREVKILEKEHKNHKGITEKVYLIQWDKEAGKEEFIIDFLIEPVIF